MQFEAYRQIEKLGYPEVDFAILNRLVTAKVKDVKANFF